MTTQILAQNDKIRVVVPDYFQFQFNSSLFEDTKYDIIPIRRYMLSVRNIMDSYECMFATVPFCKGDRLVLRTHKGTLSDIYTITSIGTNGSVRVVGDNGDSLLIKKKVLSNAMEHVFGDISKDLYDRMRTNAMVGTPEFTYYIRFDEDFYRRAEEFNNQEEVGGIRSYVPTALRDILPFGDNKDICLIPRTGFKFLCVRYYNGTYYSSFKVKRYILDQKLTEEQVKELIHIYAGGFRAEKLLPEEPIL